MYRIVILLTLISMAAMAHAQNKMIITANGRTMTAVLSDSQAADELKTRLASGPITVEMNDYGGFEKVGDLPWSLPTSNRQITTSAGDIMLYQGHSIVIFYGSNSWSYTPLGRIEGADADRIREFLSGNTLEVTFSLDNSTGVAEIDADPGREPEVFTLQGRKVRLDGRSVSDLPKGVYIIDGKKQLIK